MVGAAIFFQTTGEGTKVGIILGAIAFGLFALSLRTWKGPKMVVAPFVIGAAAAVAHIAAAVLFGE